jgi:hypothetical protein
MSPGVSFFTIHNLFSPDSAHSIVIKRLLIAEYRHAFRLRLRNQHAIKWILVRSGQ